MSEQRGLYTKYRVWRDGLPLKGWCFVIEEDDPAAPAILSIYAMLTPNQKLATDLRAKVAEIMAAEGGGGHE